MVRCHNSKVAHVVFLAVLSFFLWNMEWTVITKNSHKNAIASVKSPSPHTSSFGGVNNVAQPAGAKAAAAGEGIAFSSIIVPTSNVGHAIQSLNRQNIVNLWGHYVHDEHRSPYASHLYDQPKEVLDKHQEAFIAKMEAVRKDWGAWDLNDPIEERPTPDFSSVDYKDMMIDQFPIGAWQMDEEYTNIFLDQARALVSRMREGIYAEYGYPLKREDGTTLSEEEKAKRDELFKIHILGSDDDDTEAINKGIAKLSQVAFDGLVRKLLHAMITNDEFYMVLGGHSAAAGHGNNFQQNRIISFHKIMEPVFDKLGMRLISRNMAMGGVGTLQFTLAGGDLYGEADVIEWDSGMTEKGAAVDLFNKQAILSGERVPLIISDFHFNVMEETNGTAWMGSYINDNSMMPLTTWENFETIPYAARWFDEKEEKYNAICWEPRTDFSPEKKQAPHPQGQAGWHPGFRRHQWSGRKLALILLEGLSAAFDKWEAGIMTDGFPLDESYWHVGAKYKTIRENLRTHITTPKSTEDDVRSECEKLISWMPRICRVQMHGFGMWTPRVHSDFDFLNIIHPAMNGYKPFFRNENVYNGFDLLPLNQAIPEGQIDVHAIAIATTSPSPDLDHSWLDDDDDPAGESSGSSTTTSTAAEKPPQRRWLRQASELAFKKGTTKQDYKSQDSASQTTLPTSLRRKLGDNNTTIVPGRGWEIHGWSPVKGFCDGSAQSECTRHGDCLLRAANDNHLDVHGNSLSGWLVFTVPNVKEGIILVRMEWWCGSQEANSLTTSWTEVNDGKTTDTTPWNATGHRFLGKPTVDQLVPTDFEMDYAVNGEIKTMKREEWLTYTAEFVKNVAVWPILNDETMAQKEWEGAPMQVAIRFRSKMMPKQTYCISHVYYA